MLGKKLAAGGFGTVFRGSLMEEKGEDTEVVIKKVSLWMPAELIIRERNLDSRTGVHCKST